MKWMVSVLTESDQSVTGLQSNLVVDKMTGQTRPITVGMTYGPDDDGPDHIRVALWSSAAKASQWIKRHCIGKRAVVMPFTETEEDRAANEEFQRMATDRFNRERN
jgi:hypothetical protein